MIARLSTLTPQQVRVLMMLSGGLLNKQIAYELGVSEATVKAHVSAILQKLGVESRTQAVIAAGKIEAGQWPQVSARNAKPVDEDVDQAQHAGLPARLIVHVAHAHKGTQQVFRADVVADFAGRDSAVQQPPTVCVSRSNE
jgi:DNA-binding CsgD family transcriptional regulator